MPWGDGTGPLGFGPRTGRGLGFCSGFNSPGFIKGPGWGFGRGWGRGFGRGFWMRWRWRMRGYPWWASVYIPVYYTKEQEIEELKAEREAIREELKVIEQKLRELEKK